MRKVERGHILIRFYFMISACVPEVFGYTNYNQQRIDFIFYV